MLCVCFYKIADSFTQKNGCIRTWFVGSVGYFLGTEKSNYIT